MFETEGGRKRNDKDIPQRGECLSALSDFYLVGRAYVRGTDLELTVQFVILNT